MASLQRSPQQQKILFSDRLKTKKIQELIQNTLGDLDTSKRFVAAISSAVATTPALKECEHNSIICGALLGESLKLSHSPQIGHYYLVPFKQKAKYDRNGNEISPATTKAQFILGYKGYIQLAIRSGCYRKLNVTEIKFGELNHFDPLTEDIDVTLIDDPNERDLTPTIGYYAMFEYTNGFRKAIYWTKEQMLSHADKYSQAFSKEIYQKILNGDVPDRDMWKYSSFWYKDFDAMAKKTMLRQLISKWGQMSVEIQTAFTHDYVTADVSTKGNLFIEETAGEQANDAEYINEVVNRPDATDAVEIPMDDDDGDLFDDD